MRDRLAAACLTVTLLLAWAGGARAQQIPLIRDDEIELLLADYAQPILKAAALPQEGAVKVHVINDKSFNAFVLDANNIYVHMGALMQSDTPNQIIGVIAHETGHIDGAHIAAMRSRMAREQTRLLLLRLLGIGAAVLARSGQAVVAGDELVVRGFLAERRAQEATADQAGLKYLGLTHQSGRGMIETFERLAQTNRQFGQINPYLLDHPTDDVRIRQLRDAVVKSPYYNVKDSQELQDRHNLVKAKLFGFTSLPVDVERLYPPSDTSLPARYARAIAHNCSGTCARAIGEVDGLIKDRPNSPFFYQLKGELLTKDAKWREAIPPLRRALALLNNRSALIRLELGKALVELNDPGQLDEAIRVLEVALEREEDDVIGFRTLARAYAAKGRIPDADIATARMHLAAGNREEAVIFAKRGLAKLSPGSPNWIKGDDIIKIRSQPGQ